MLPTDDIYAILLVKPSNCICNVSTCVDNVPIFFSKSIINLSANVNSFLNSNVNPSKYAICPCNADMVDAPNAVKTISVATVVAIDKTNAIIDVKTPSEPPPFKPFLPSFPCIPCIP